MDHEYQYVAHPCLAMDVYKYESIQQMHGSLRQAAVAEPAAFERANYLQVLGSYGHDPRFAPSRALVCRAL
jgi:hypothetical protein